MSDDDEPKVEDTTDASSPNVKNEGSQVTEKEGSVLQIQEFKEETEKRLSQKAHT